VHTSQSLSFVSEEPVRIMLERGEKHDVSAFRLPWGAIVSTHCSVCRQEGREGRKEGSIPNQRGQHDWMRERDDKAKGTSRDSKQGLEAGTRSRDSGANEGNTTHCLLHTHTRTHTWRFQRRRVSSRELESAKVPLQLISVARTHPLCPSKSHRFSPSSAPQTLTL